MRRLALSLLSAAVLAGACEEATEGCLDYRAIGIDVMADKECEACCVYPRLKLQLVPADAQGDSITSVYRAGDLIGLGSDSTRLQQLGFFVSDVALIGSSGESYPLYDTLAVRDSSGNVARGGEVSLLRVRPFVGVDYSLGSLLPLDEFTGIRMQFGIGAELAASDAEQPNTASPLVATNDFLLYDTTAMTFRSAAVVLQLPDSTFRTLEVPGGQRWPVEVDFPEPIQLTRAYNLSVRMALPVARLIALRDQSETSAEQLAELLFTEATVTSVGTTRE